MKTLKKELPYFLLSIIPFIYLLFIYSDLNRQVPTHWNISGEIDAYSEKSFLFVILLLLIGINYIIFLVLPKIDPKQKLQNMGAKLGKLRLLMTLFMSALGFYIVYLSKNETVNPQLIFPLVGLLIAGMGNYFQTLQPNYFIGIRTPWTLENEIVWKKTHQLGGKLWFVGGIIMALTFLLPESVAMIFFIATAILLTIIPIAYSYITFKGVKGSNVS